MNEDNFLLGEISESLKTMNKELQTLNDIFEISESLKTMNKELQTLNDILKRIMNNMDRW